MARLSAIFLALAVATISASVTAQPPEPAGPPLASDPVDSAEAGPARLDVSPSFLARYELRENYADLGLAGRRIGELDGVAYRARFGVHVSPYQIRPGWHAELEFVPQASGFWGDVSGGLTDAGLGIHEGNLALVNRALRLEVGRFEMAYGDHLVIGDVGWHETGRSFDGVRAAIPLSDERGSIDLFATQVAEGGATSVSTEVASGDIYFVGVYARLGELIAKDRTVDLDTYLLGQLAVGDDTAMPATETALELTLGARAKKKLGTVAIRGEAGIQIGQRPDADSVLAGHVDADIMAKLAPRTQLGAGLFYATGDDPMTERDTGWNQLYPTAHKFLGFMDIIGPRSNIFGGVVKLRQAVSSELKLGVDGHLFARPERPDGVEALTGLEADIWLGWAIGNGLSLRSQYAVFLASSDGPLASDDVAHFVEIQLLFVQ